MLKIEKNPLLCHYYVIEINTSCEAENFYMPHEISLIEFTFRDGITCELSKIMGPKILLQMALQLKTSEAITKYRDSLSKKIPNLVDSYTELYEMMIDFCHKSVDGDDLQLICFENDIHIYESCLSYIRDKAALQKELSSNKKLVLRSISSVVSKWLILPMNTAVLKVIERMIKETCSITDEDVKEFQPDGDKIGKHMIDAACPYHQLSDSYTCTLVRCKIIFSSITSKFLPILEAQMEANNRPHRNPNLPSDNLHDQQFSTKIDHRSFNKMFPLSPDFQSIFSLSSHSYPCPEMSKINLSKTGEEALLINQLGFHVDYSHSEYINYWSSIQTPSHVPQPYPTARSSLPPTVRTTESIPPKIPRTDSIMRMDNYALLDAEVQKLVEEDTDSLDQLNLGSGDAVDSGFTQEDFINK